MFVLYVLLGIVVLLLMVVIHEFGHYIAGKILKFKINEFSVGFGPKLLQKKKKNGEKFTLRLIPLGGYCAFAGEDNADGTTIGKKDEDTDAQSSETGEESVSESSAETSEDDEKPTEKRDYLLFDEQKPWKRIIVLLAGPLLNFLSAILFSFLFILCVGYSNPVVEQVFTAADGSPYNPLIAGDQIVAVDGNKINVMHSYSDLLGTHSLGDTVTLTVIRNGKEIELANVTVKDISYYDEKSQQQKDYQGFGFQTSNKYKAGDLGASFIYCVPLTFKFSWMILGSFGQLLTGQIPITELTGPIGTVESFATTASAGWQYIFLWLPLIASNLAIFNILPIPALDGSKIVFTTIEWIRGKPVNKKVENIIHFIGIVLLFGLVIVVDLIGLFTRGGCA